MPVQNDPQGFSSLKKTISSGSESKAKSAGKSIWDTSTFYATFSSSQSEILIGFISPQRIPSFSIQCGGFLPSLLMLWLAFRLL